MEGKLFYIAMRIWIILIAFSFSANAQSRHASVWNLCNFHFDFGNESSVISEIPSYLKNSVYYVDKNGDTRLILRNNGLYNGKLERISTEENPISWDYQHNFPTFFVPNPTDENYVFLFNMNDYYLIDLSKNGIVDYKINFDELKFCKVLAVHSADCKSILLIYMDSEKIIQYKIQNKKIEYVGTEYLQKNNYPKGFVGSIDRFTVNLSKNCDYYVATEPDWTFLYYGRFDRQAGSFIRLGSFDYSSDSQNGVFSRVVASIISNDGTKLYFTACKADDNSFCIAEVDIKNGIPDYENYRIFYHDSHRSFFSGGYNFYYGYDSKIYTYNVYLDTEQQQFNLVFQVGTIDADENGKTFFNYQTFEHAKYMSYTWPFFVSSWFSDNSCECSQQENKKLKIICE